MIGLQTFVQGHHTLFIHLYVFLFWIGVFSDSVFD